MNPNNNKNTFQSYFFAIIFAFSAICFAQSIEEELKLFGGDEFILEESEREKVKDAIEATEISDTTQAALQDSTTLQDTTAQSNALTTTDTVATSSAKQSDTISTSTDTVITPKISVFDTAGVSKESEIDFSRNLNEYRSPQKALFASLLIPGLGQIYNKKYWRAGLYVAIEAGMIGGAVYFNKASRDWRKDAEKWKDTHFNSDSLRNFYDTLSAKTKEKYGNDTTANYLIFGVNSGFIDDTEPSEDGTKSSAIDKYMEQFYEDEYGRTYGAGSARFAARGWDDLSNDPQKDFFKDQTENGYNAIFDAVDTTALKNILARGNSVFGVSGNQKTFLYKLDKSRERKTYSSLCIVGIFANHIASAADAFVSAILHNRRLLREESGEKITKGEEVLSNISIESDMYFDYKNELTTKLGFVWHF